ncbi:MAG: hypothetical protein M3552_12925 [Planctomycetota bacterium]|nr:hypothetical protein [Planctomycetaceae bacterium]MDQ3331536.1 hypothetical protein [Planctomycetota bacterium]
MTQADIVGKTFMLCLKNEGYEADLDVGTVYLVLPDEVAAARDRIRVIDESGEDYLYPSEFFMPVALSRSAKDVLSVG